MIKNGDKNCKLAVYLHITDILQDFCKYYEQTLSELFVTRFALLFANQHCVCNNKSGSMATFDFHKLPMNPPIVSYHIHNNSKHP